MQLDGEVDQISVFKDASVVELMHKNRIVIAKSSAGRTAVEQPCDVGNIFRGSKARFRKYKNAEHQSSYVVPLQFINKFHDLWKVHHT
jgi:hypothetical protein